MKGEGDFMKIKEGGVACFFYANKQRSGAMSPAGGGTPVDLQFGMKWGWVRKSNSVYKKIDTKKEFGVPTPNSSPLGDGFAFALASSPHPPEAEKVSSRTFY